MQIDALSSQMKAIRERYRRPPVCPEHDSQCNRTLYSNLARFTPEMTSRRIHAQASRRHERGQKQIRTFKGYSEELK